MGTPDAQRSRGLPCRPFRAAVEWTQHPEPRLCLVLGLAPGPGLTLAPGPSCHPSTGTVPENCWPVSAFSWVLPWLLLWPLLAATLPGESCWAEDAGWHLLCPLHSGPCWKASGRRFVTVMEDTLGGVQTIPPAPVRREGHGFWVATLPSWSPPCTAADGV